MDTPPHHRPPSENRVQGHISGTSIQVGTLRGDVHLTGERRRPPPRQLPTPPATFVRRSESAAMVSDALARARTHRRNGLVVLTGVAGVGKTALATRFLHDHAELSADGALFVDLRGFSEGRVTDPYEALEVLLVSLGVEPGTVPADLAARAAMWRSVTDRTRIALLLDDAFSAAQVRSLLPGGEKSTVIVTSRIHLAGLRIDGAEIITVSPLDSAQGVELLTRLSGRPPATSQEEAAIGHIVDLCAGLPVAVCTVAIGESSHRWRSWNRVERRLRDTSARLGRLSETGERIGLEVSVRGAFDLSYRNLDPAQARLYRRLSWHPGPDLTSRIASYLTGDPVSACEGLLEDLAHHHLLTEYRDGRYGFHDLLHLHAREKAAEEETPSAFSEGVGRLLEMFGDLSVAADALLRPYAVAPPALEEAPFSTPAEATEWLHDERRNLAALAELALTRDHPRRALRLVEGLWSLFLHHGQASLYLRAVSPAITGARELGETRALGRLLNKRALVYGHLGRVDDAMADLADSERIWTAAGDLERVAQTRQRRGILAFRNRRFDEALVHLQDALEVDEQTGIEHNKAITLMMLGRAHLAAGSPVQAQTHLERALPLLSGDPYNAARVRIALGSVLVARSVPVRARREAEAALEVMRARGSSSGEGRAWEVLGEVAEYEGDPTRARSAYERASALLATGDPARKRVEQRLEGLG